MGAHHPSRTLLPAATQRRSQSSRGHSAELRPGSGCLQSPWSIVRLRPYITAVMWAAATAALTDCSAAVCPASASRAQCCDEPSAYRNLETNLSPGNAVGGASTSSTLKLTSTAATAQDSFQRDTRDPLKIQFDSMDVQLDNTSHSGTTW